MKYPLAAFALACLAMLPSCDRSTLYSDAEAQRIAARIPTLDLKRGVQLADAMTALHVDLDRLECVSYRHSSLALHRTYRLSSSHFMHLTTEFIVVPRDRENPKVFSAGVDKTPPGYY